jgi:hypothetical protein
MAGRKFGGKLGRIWFTFTPGDAGAVYTREQRDGELSLLGTAGW